MISKPICHQCKHFCLNHGEGVGIGCRAFPNGIPDAAKIKHSSVIDGQTGTYVFERVSYDELPPFTKTIWDDARKYGLPI